MDLVNLEGIRKAAKKKKKKKKKKKRDIHTDTPVQDNARYLHTRDGPQ